jgi:membrane-associated protease RseP (regulator of RpoE activity)
VRTQDEVQRLIDAVRVRFNVTQEYLREGEALEFYIDENEKDTGPKFASLVAELEKSGDTAVLRRTTDHGLFLLVLKKPHAPKQRLRTPLILFAATLAAVFADGVLRAMQYSDPVTKGVSTSQALVIGLVYTASLMGILGIHELGHKVAAWYHKMGSTWPYFIPGIPSVWPTFGAVIRSWDPPLNRDALFDLGLSGPVAGLVVAIVVSVIAVASANIFPASLLPAGTHFSATDFYTTFLVNAIKAPPSSSVIGGPMFTDLYFAYSIGFVITFINLLPAWQLDGGHITNAAVSPRIHKYLTYVSALIMVLVGFWLMAVLVLVMGSSSPSLRPLDDVSPLSRNRKILFILTWVLSAAIYALIVYNNAFFSFQSFL